MDIKISQIISEAEKIKKLLVDIVGDEKRVNSLVEIENLEVRYAFPNTLNLKLPNDAKEIAVKGEGVNWPAEVRAKLQKLKQEV